MKLSNTSLSLTLSSNEIREDRKSHTSHYNFRHNVSDIYNSIYKLQFLIQANKK